jgi:chromosome segregation ATPase
MYCHNCGEKSQTQDKFCKNCGESLQSEKIEGSQSDDTSVNSIYSTNLNSLTILGVVFFVIFSLIGNIYLLQAKEDLQGKLSEKKEMVDVLSEDVAQLESSNENKKEEIQNKKDVINSQQEEIDDLDSRVGSLKSELKGLRDRKKQIQGQIASLEDKKKKIQEDLGSCRYVLNISGELASVYQKQSSAYRKATNYSTKSVSYFVDKDYESALYYAKKAKQKMEIASSYNAQINSLFNKIDA